MRQVQHRGLRHHGLLTLRALVMSTEHAVLRTPKLKILRVSEASIPASAKAVAAAPAIAAPALSSMRASEVPGRRVPGQALAARSRTRDLEVLAARNPARAIVTRLVMQDSRLPLQPQ